MLEGFLQILVAAAAIAAASCCGLPLLLLLIGPLGATLLGRKREAQKPSDGLRSGADCCGRLVGSVAGRLSSRATANDGVLPEPPAAGVLPPYDLSSVNARRAPSNRYLQVPGLLLAQLRTTSRSDTEVEDA